MRTLLLVSLFLVSNILSAQYYSSFIKDLPVPNRVVNDFGGFFTPNQKNTLDDSLVSYRRRTGSSIVVITLSTLTDHNTGTTWSVEETALQYFNKWGIGDRNKNNGVLVLISKEPRRVRITTGAGVDKVLTDNECQRIINEAIVPSFKLGKYYTGIKTGIHDIEAVLDSKVQPEPDEDNSALQPVATQPQSLTQQSTDGNTKKKEPTAGDFMAFLLVLAVMAWFRVLYVRSKRKKTAEANGTSIDLSNNTLLMDWLSAAGWSFLWLCFWWILLILWYRRRGSGSGSYSSSYSNVGYNNNYNRGNSYSSSSYSDGYDDGYDRGRSNDRSFFSRRSSGKSSGSGSSGKGSSGGGSSSGGSSSSGSGSYGGGSSNGGGATGSW